MAVHADSTPARVFSSLLERLEDLFQAHTKIIPCFSPIMRYLQRLCIFIKGPNIRIWTVPLLGETGFPYTYSFYDVSSKVFLEHLLFETGLKTGFETGVFLRIGRVNELIRPKV